MQIRAAGIPLWVTLFAGFLAILSTTIGIVTLFFDHTVAIGYIEGADRLAMTWAGRNGGLGLAMIVALLLRSPAAYAAAFLGCASREISDLLYSLAGPFNPGEVTIISVILILDLIAFTLCLRTAVRDRSRFA